MVSRQSEHRNSFGIPKNCHRSLDDLNPELVLRLGSRCRIGGDGSVLNHDSTMCESLVQIGVEVKAFQLLHQKKNDNFRIPARLTKNSIQWIPMPYFFGPIFAAGDVRSYHGPSEWALPQLLI